MKHGYMKDNSAVAENVDGGRSTKGPVFNYSDRLSSKAIRQKVNDSDYEVLDIKPASGTGYQQPGSHLSVDTRLSQLSLEKFSGVPCADAQLSDDQKVYLGKCHTGSAKVKKHKTNCYRTSPFKHGPLNEKQGPGMVIDPSHNLKKRMKAGIRKVQEEVARPKRYPVPSVVPRSLYSNEMKKGRLKNTGRPMVASGPTIQKCKGIMGGSSRTVSCDQFHSKNYKQDMYYQAESPVSSIQMNLSDELRRSESEAESPVSSIQMNLSNELRRPECSIHLNSCVSFDSSQEGCNEDEGSTSYTEHIYRQTYEDGGDQTRRQVNNNFDKYQDKCAIEVPYKSDGFEETDVDDVVISACQSASSSDVNDFLKREKASFTGGCKPDNFNGNYNTKRDRGSDSDGEPGNYVKPAGVVSVSFAYRSLHQENKTTGQGKETDKSSAKSCCNHEDCSFDFHINDSEKHSLKTRTFCENDDELPDVDRIPSNKIWEALDSLNLSMTESALQSAKKPLEYSSAQSDRVIKSSSIPNSSNSHHKHVWSSTGIKKEQNKKAVRFPQGKSESPDTFSRVANDKIKGEKEIPCKLERVDSGISLSGMSGRMSSQDETSTLGMFFDGSNAETFCRNTLEFDLGYAEHEPSVSYPEMSTKYERAMERNKNSLNLQVVATAKPIMEIRPDQINRSRLDPGPPPLFFTINARPPAGFLYYFAYGMDMNHNRMSIYLRREVRHRLWGVLYGFQLIFNKIGTSREAGGFPNIKVNAEHSVEGYLYTITETELSMLDNCMGFPRHYTRVVLPIWTLNCPKPSAHGVAQYCVPALVYVAQDEWVTSDNERMPDCTSAVKQCIKSADLLTPSYVRYIASLADV